MTILTPSFISQWSSDVKHVFQQESSKLIDAVRVIRDVEGSTYNFHVMGKGVAIDRIPGAPVTPLNSNNAQVSCTLGDLEATVLVDNLDKLKTNIDTRKEYVKFVANAMARAVDAKIIAAANLATTTGATTTGGFTYAKLLEVVSFFNKNNVNPEDRYLVISAAQLNEAFNIDQLIKSNYHNIEAIASGEIASALGMKWIIHEGLAKSAGVRTCLAFNKQALGVAMGQDIITKIADRPDINSTQFSSYASLGATVVDNTGIIKMSCAEA